MSKIRVLFILKYRETSGGTSSYDAEGGTALSSGLLNSAQFVSDMLNGVGVESKIVSVVDNNDIDREVSQYKPTHAVIEALWVVPEKFDVLAKLHPTVKWIVRLHSQTPFLSQEGIALDWIANYVTQKNVFLGVNHQQTARDMRVLLDAMGVNPVKNILYLPNYYPTVNHPYTPVVKDHYLDIACFGAIRPFKNTLVQALAAIEYAERENKHLRFHINGNRQEQNGEQVYKNIKGLFTNAGHQLVEHDWLPHPEFVKLLKTMDLGLAVSFTETFCIVAADYTSVGLPMVVSNQVSWASNVIKAKPTETFDIVEKIGIALGWKSQFIVNANWHGLNAFSYQAKQDWLKALYGI